jgi:hypothetical protein
MAYSDSYNYRGTFSTSALDWIIGSFLSAVRFIGEAIWSVFNPDARTSLDLDRLSHQAAAEAIAPKTSKFKAFICASSSSNPTSPPRQAFELWLRARHSTVYSDRPRRRGGRPRQALRLRRDRHSS